MQARDHYRVHLMPDAEPTDDGIRYRRGEASSTLEWERVRHAVAAEVGEPEGVRTIVFDFVVEPPGPPDPSEGRAGGPARVAYRFDADPCDGAMEVARVIEDALGPERSSPSIKSVAADGRPGDWYPDLESFEDAVLETLQGS